MGRAQILRILVTVVILAALESKSLQRLVPNTSAFGSRSRPSKLAKAKLANEFMETFKTVQPEFIREMQAPMSKLVVGILAEKFSEVQGKVGALEKNTHQMQIDLKAQGEELAKQGQSLVSLHEKFDKVLAGNSLHRSSSAPTIPSQGPALRSQVAPPPPPTGFFRDTNKTILYVTTQGATDVTKDSIKHAVSVLALEANIVEDDFEVLGENLGSKFEISFVGTFSGAAAKANQYLLSLRRGPGDFKTQEVVTPAGPKVTFYVNPDKNGATVRMEILSKQLLGVIRELCPQKQFFLRRNEGTIFVDRRPLVRVLVESQESTVLSWKHQKRVAINLDDAIVDSKFRDFQKEPGGGEPWS